MRERLDGLLDGVRTRATDTVARLEHLPGRVWAGAAVLTAAVSLAVYVALLPDVDQVITLPPLDAPPAASVAGEEAPDTAPDAPTDEAPGFAQQFPGLDGASDTVVTGRLRATGDDEAEIVLADGPQTFPFGDELRGQVAHLDGRTVQARVAGGQLAELLWVGE